MSEVVVLNLHYGPAWTGNPFPIPAGTRIELIAMPQEPDPIPVGARGTVRQHVNLGSDFEQIWVGWDNERHLALIPGVDVFRIIRED